MKGERWKEIPGYEGLYEVSNKGNVRALRYNKVKIHKPVPEKEYTKGRMPYRRLFLTDANGKRKQFKVGHLVLIAWRGPKPTNKEMSHLNGNPQDDRLCNLKWETHKKNCERKKSHVQVKYVSRKKRKELAWQLLKAIDEDNWGPEPEVTDSSKTEVN